MQSPAAGCAATRWGQLRAAHSPCVQPQRCARAAQCASARSRPHGFHRAASQVARASAPAPTLAAGTASAEGLVFSRGQPGSWDEAGVGSPVVGSARTHRSELERAHLQHGARWRAGSHIQHPGVHWVPQVRCFVGDNEDRWCMWYSGRKEGALALDAIAPSSGSLGAWGHHTTRGNDTNGATTGSSSSSTVPMLWVTRDPQPPHPRLCTTSTSLGASRARSFLLKAHHA